MKHIYHRSPYAASRSRHDCDCGRHGADCRCYQIVLRQQPPQGGLNAANL